MVIDAPLFIAIEAAIAPNSRALMAAAVAHSPSPSTFSAAT